MILIQDVIVSADILEEEFICNLERCKGACCVAGDRGAPLTKAEVKEIKKELPAIRPYLTPAYLYNIEKYNFFEKDEDEYVTTCNKKGGECNFLVYEDGTAFCGIEKAWRAGATSFRKPVSCHLYPIRERQLKNYTGIDYHRWKICSPACALGKEKKVKVYQFLKDPLIRRFGEAWYDELVEVAKAYEEERSRGRKR